MRTFITILLSLAASCSMRPALAQCSASFNFTADGSQAQIDNRTNGCIDFQVTYNAANALALSLEVESAPDAGGVPGAWVSFAGTIVTGVNPNVDTEQNYTLLRGYYPWVRVTLSGLMGASARVRGTLKGSPAALESGTPVFPQPAEVEGCDDTGTPPTCKPVPTAHFDGTDVETDFVCNTPTPLTLTASGNTEIVALTAMKSIRICHISLSGDSTVNVKLTTGTGSNCGTGTADLTGFYNQAVSIALDFQQGAALRAPAGNAVCVNLSGASNWGGVVVYGKF